LVCKLILATTLSGNTLSMDSDGNLRMYIDANNDQTDAIFSIGRDNNSTSGTYQGLFNVREDGSLEAEIDPLVVNT
jgi:hypothetical protein